MAVVGVAGLMIALGAFAGAVIGMAQGLVLRRPLPKLAIRSWVLATLLGAVVAWTLGMVPSTLMHLSAGAENLSLPEIPPVATLALASGMGAVLSVVLATPQWLVLRRFVQHAVWWLPANLLAWACGMPIIFHWGPVTDRSGATACHIP